MNDEPNEETLSDYVGGDYPDGYRYTVEDTDGGECAEFNDRMVDNYVYVGLRFLEDEDFANALEAFELSNEAATSRCRGEPRAMTDGGIPDDKKPTKCAECGETREDVEMALNTWVEEVPVYNGHRHPQTGEYMKIDTDRVERGHEVPMCASCRADEPEVVTDGGLIEVDWSDLASGDVVDVELEPIGPNDERQTVAECTVKTVASTVDIESRPPEGKVFQALPRREIDDDWEPSVNKVGEKVVVESPDGTQARISGTGGDVYKVDQEGDVNGKQFDALIGTEARFYKRDGGAA